MDEASDLGGTLVDVALPFVAGPSVGFSWGLTAFRSPRQGGLSWESFDRVLIGLNVHQDAPMHTWSSGQKQRLHLSLALGTESPVVLLDEPASNLDAQGIEWLHKVIPQVASFSTLVVATNDPCTKEAPGSVKAILEV